MDQLVYILVIAAAMVFGWYLFQKRQAERNEQQTPPSFARRSQKKRPRKKR